MDKLIKQLDENLEYIGDSFEDDTLVIRVQSSRDEVECPYCHHVSNRVHDRTQRTLQDLPVMGNKVKIVATRRIMKCTNPECSHNTFAERFDCYAPYARRTERLTDKIVDLTLDTSALAASANLQEGICNVGKSTLCKLLKKKRPSSTKSSTQM